MSHHRKEEHLYYVETPRPQPVFEVETEGNISQVESRKSFRPSDTTFLLVAILLVLLTGTEELMGYECGDHSVDNVISVIFYASLIWLVYLTVTLIVKYSQEKFRKLFRLVDILIMAIFSAIWIAALISYYTYPGSEYSTEKGCSVAVYLLHCYVILGWAAVAMLLAVILFYVIKRITGHGFGGKHRDDESKEYVQH
jgi:hypothetical protein